MTSTKPPGQTPLDVPRALRPQPAGRAAGGGQAAVRAGSSPGLAAGRGAGGVAFVFAGGGSLTAPQAGMLRALTEAGVLPDLVIGASAGSVNAVAFAGDPTPAGMARLEVVWSSLRRRDVAPFSARTLLAAARGRGTGLVTSSGLRDVLAGAALARSLQETQIPAFVVATDLVSGDPIIMADGDTVPALVASCAFPGLYPPVRLAGRLLIDGGVSAGIPIVQAEELGASVVCVLPAATYGSGTSLPRGPARLAFRALGQLLDAAARCDASAASIPVHVLPAPASTAASPVDFRDTSRLISEGYRLAAGCRSRNGGRASHAAAAAGPRAPR